MPVMTVNGPIDAGELGITLPHEHLFVDLRFTWKQPDDPVRRRIGLGDVKPEHLHLLKNDLGAVRANLVLDDPASAARELGRFKAAGGATIVTDLGSARMIRSATRTRKSMPPAASITEAAMMTARMMSITSIGGEVGLTPKATTRTSSPTAPQRPRPTPL